MKAWSYWYPDILPHVMGCPDPIVDKEILSAAQKLFHQTRAWQMLLPAFAVAQGQASVPVTFSDAGIELVRIEKAWYDGNDLAETTLENMDRAFSGDWTSHTGTPSQRLQLMSGTVMLYPVPAAAALSGLRLRVAVAPSDAATGLDDAMAMKYRQAIATGALANLLGYSKGEWVNHNHAASMARDFSAMLDGISADVFRSFGSARPNKTPRWC